MKLLKQHIQEENKLFCMQ